MLDTVSIIIPSYNNERYVGRAIESAIEQTYDNVEIIVIDDGSTDDSLRTIQRYDSSITWQSQKNQGAPTARNRGLELANGEFVKFLDSDDVLARDAIERQIGQMRDASSTDEVVFGDLATINGKEEVIEERVTYGRLDYGECAQLEDILKENILTSCPLYRQNHLNEVDGFDEGITKAQEYFMNIRLVLIGVKFRYKKCMCFYNRRNTKRRITSKNHLRDDPMYGLRDIKMQVEKISKIEKGEVLSPIKESFAKSLWRKGRRLLRLGNKEEACTYFEEARSLYPEAPVVGSSMYRFLASLLGPSTAERIGEVKRLLHPYKSPGPVDQ